MISFSVCFRADDSYSDPNGEVMEGLSRCIERMISDEVERDLVVTEQVYVESRVKFVLFYTIKESKRHSSPW